MTLPPNPKKIMGDKKPDLGQLPLAGMVHQSLAHMDGAYKYGFRNWRKDPVEVNTYIGAMMRHIQLYSDGEDFARDTGVHNLGGVMACCAILLDAEVNNTLIDNRSKSPGACDLLHAAEAMVTRLKAAQAERDAAKAVPPVAVDHSKAVTVLCAMTGKSCPTPRVCADFGQCSRR